MEKTVVELFAGVGGFRVGFNNVKLENGYVIENKDWNFVWVNQWEPSTKSQPAFECYTARFGDSENHVNEDISKVNKQLIPDHTILVGGFPCQDYSVARSLSNEKGIEGKKGVLWWQINDIINEKETPFIILENVDRLLKSTSKQRGRDFGIILRSLYDSGYDVEWRVINAAEYGSPQKRRRVFIFGYKRDTNYYDEVENYTSNQICKLKGLFARSFPVNQEFEYKIAPKEIDISENSEYRDLVDVSDNFEFNFLNTGVMRNGIIYTIQTSPIFEDAIKLGEIMVARVNDKSYYLDEVQIKKFEYLKGSKKILRTRVDGTTYNYSEGKMEFPDSHNQPGRTMLTSEGTTNRSTHVVRDLESNQLRKITPVEAERLNGFPDDWTNTGMSTRQRYFMMGNALVVDIVSRISVTLSSIVDLE